MLINPAFYPTLAVAAVLFWLGFKIFRGESSPLSRWLLLLLAVALALPCLICDLYYTHLFDNWAWFYTFRTAPLSELTLAGAGLIAGMLYRKFDPETLGEKCFVPVVLLVVMGAPFSKSALAPVDLDRLQQTCNTEVCLQSTPSTCGPTSAATLLKLYGTPVSEREIAQDALTYRGGTEAWYLARAIRRRGFDTEFVFENPTSPSFPSPSIAGVILPGGAGHFVAILDSKPDRVIIGDPLVGKVVLDRSNLGTHYRFTGFFLLVRKKQS